MKIRNIFLFPLCTVTLALSFAAFADELPEIRAMWVSRFDGWVSSNQATSKSAIDTIMSTAAQNNFNTVLFQVRGQCETFYNSPYEPWSVSYNYTNPGWNPAAYAITKAHENGLEFHAYINTHVMCGSSGVSVSTSPEHVYNIHGPNATGSDCWVICDENGNPVTAADSYVWISPGHPEASAWTRKQIMYFLENYNVDGLHFDRIRCPSPAYSHDVTTQARFAGDGNPDGLGWADFMRRQFTDDLRRIYGQAAMIRPAVKISAAPFGIMYKDATTQYQGTGNQAYHTWYQDGFGWMQQGCLDFIVPQIYWTVGSAHPYEKLLADWLSHTGTERFVVGGSTTGNGQRTVDQVLAEHEQTRLQGAAGWCEFSYSTISPYLNALKSTRFTTAVAPPEMTWKTSPTKGIITGYVTDANSNAVTDARIVLAGDTLLNAAGTAPYNHLTGADGFYAILNVPVGTTHQLTYSKDGETTVIKTNVAVTAGAVTQVDVQFSSESPTTLVVNSRDTTNGTYSEGTGNWSNTTAASTAAGSNPNGGRYVSNLNPGATATYYPTLTGAGKYNVYVTIPGAYNTISSPGASWTLRANGNVVTSGTVDLVYTNTAVADAWGMLASNVILPAGAGKTSLTFVNNNAYGENGRFVMSGVKFEAVGAVPVGMSEISLE